MHAIPEEIAPSEGHLTEGLIESSKRSHNGQHQNSELTFIYLTNNLTNNVKTYI